MSTASCGCEAEGTVQCDWHRIEALLVRIGDLEDVIRDVILFYDPHSCIDAAAMDRLRAILDYSTEDGTP